MVESGCELSCFFCKALAKNSGKQCQLLAFSTYMGGGMIKIGRCSLCVIMNAFQNLSVDFSIAVSILFSKCCLSLTFWHHV